MHLGLRRTSRRKPGSEGQDDPIYVPVRYDSRNFRFVTSPVFFNVFPFLLSVWILPIVIDDLTALS